MLRLINNRHCSKRPKISNETIFQDYLDKVNQQFKTAVINYNIEEANKSYRNNHHLLNETIIETYNHLCHKYSYNSEKKFIKSINYLIDRTLNGQGYKHMITTAIENKLPDKTIDKLMDKEVSFTDNELKYINNVDINTIIKLENYLLYLDIKNNNSLNWEEFTKSSALFKNIDGLMEYNKIMRKNIDDKTKIQLDEELFKTTNTYEIIQLISYGADPNTYKIIDNCKIPFYITLIENKKWHLLEAFARAKNINLDVSYNDPYKTINNKNRSLLMDLIECIDKCADKEQIFKIINIIVPKHDLKKQMTNGISALTAAIKLEDENYSYKISKLLLKHDRSLANQESTLQETPFYISARNGKLKICKMLEEIAPNTIYKINPYNKKNGLQEAAENGHYEVCKYYKNKLLIKKYDRNNILFNAVLSKDYRIIKLFANKKNVKLENKGKNPHTIFMINSYKFNKEHAKISYLLLNLGADVDQIFADIKNNKTTLLIRDLHILNQTKTNEEPDKLLLKKIIHLLDNGADPTKTLDYKELEKLMVNLSKISDSIGYINFYNRLIKQTNLFFNINKKEKILIQSILQGLNGCNVQKTSQLLTI